MARTAPQTIGGQTHAAVNRSLAQATLQVLIDQGVTEFVVCPGARNAPLLEWLAASPSLRCRYFSDERAAAFFALGRCKASARPVAVITSSGTAAAELLPAAIEAHYSQLPLVLITADRPHRFRHSGAPQSIIQPGLYGSYVEQACDWSAPEDVKPLQIQGQPVHLNICLEEPQPLGPLPALHSAPHAQHLSEQLWGRVCLEEVARAESFFAQCERPLLVLGELAPALSEQLPELLGMLPGYIYAEAQSNLGSAQLGARVLHSGERVLQQRPFAFDGVLRIGGIPTTRLWRDLEQELETVPVLSATCSAYPGLGRATQPPISLASLKAAIQGLLLPVHTDSDVMATDAQHHQHLQGMLSQHPRSELALMQALRERIPVGVQVFLGNSQPIRHWDQIAAGDARHQVFSNRGANGIDGLISTGLGLAADGEETWIIVGDLSALYDLQALWAVDADWLLRIVVINNQGGRIFEPMFPQPDFINRHGFNFRGWAQMFQLEYQRVQHPEDIALKPCAQVIELQADNTGSAAFRAALG